MKNIDEIKNKYPFFSNASQPSSPGEIFMNRNLFTADIVMQGYRDEVRGCTIKSRIPIAKSKRWYLNMANEYDRMNTDILRFIDSHPNAFFNVMDNMALCSTNEYGNSFAESFSTLPAFANLGEALHTIRLNKTMEESLCHIIKYPSTQEASLVDYQLDGRPIYPIGKIVPDSANVTYISIVLSDEMSRPSLILLFNAYEEHLYFTLVIETHLEKIGNADVYRLRTFTSAFSDVDMFYGELNEKLRLHDVLAEPYGRFRKYTLPSNPIIEVHIFPTFVSPWGTANLCAAVYQNGAPCKFIGYTNMAYAAEGYYYAMYCSNEILERFSELILKELL